MNIRSRRLSESGRMVIEEKFAEEAGLPPARKLRIRKKSKDLQEQFLDAMAGLERFIAIGEAFSGGESLGLRTAIRHKGRSYLAHFHRERLDELRMRLETETWRGMPLQAGWTLSQLRELAPLQPASQAQ